MNKKRTVLATGSRRCDFFGSLCCSREGTGDESPLRLPPVAGFTQTSGGSKVERRTPARRQRRAAIAVLAAICLVIVVGFLAFSIDLGYIVVAESELQNAADASAVSASVALSEGRGAAIAAAKAWASKNFAAGEPVVVTDSDVEIGVWKEDTARFTVLPEGSADTPNAVRVTCRRTTATGNPLNLFFARVMGTNHADLTVSATARSNILHRGLIVGVSGVSMVGGSHTDSYNAEHGAYGTGNANANGHVCSNGDICMSGSSAIRGNGHPGPGYTVKSTSSVGVLGKVKPLEEPMRFPPIDPGDAADCNDNASIPVSDRGVYPLNGAGDFSLSHGDGIDLSPGTYYFNRMTLSGGSVVRISGPTVLYVADDCRLDGGRVVNMTCLPKNLEVYVMGANCAVPGDAEFYGLIYAPTANVKRSGESDFFGAIVAGNLTLGGSSGTHADESLGWKLFQYGPRRAELVE